MSHTASPVKTGASQSVGRSRPPPINNSSTSAGVSSNSKTRRNVAATSILHKVQLKKTIQYGTYQSSINNMQMSLLNSHTWNQQGADPTLSTSV